LSKNLELKKEKVAEITQKLRNAKCVVLVSYSGITVEEITSLRAKCRDAGVDYVVYKNNLMIRALDSLDIHDFDHLLVGPCAYAFSDNDPVAPAKVLTDYITQSRSNKISIKAGLVEGQFMDVAGVDALAKLPSKDVLVARLMGSLNAPITNLVGVLSATLRSLVYAIEAVRKQKAGESSPAD
jgi:large subunit ribosomal protein L10